jgi:hypothetical protein
MTKTMLGSIAVILCGVLLMPLLVDTTGPSALGPVPAAHQLSVAELASGR